MRKTLPIVYGFWVGLLIVLFVTSASIADDVRSTAAGRQNPILLVHGLGSDTSSWGHLPEYLRNRGYEVYVLDYNKWYWLPNAYHNEMLIGDLCVVLARELENIVKQTGKGHVNIIAHSVGGIIVRAYIAGWGEAVETASGYNDDINKVIYLGTPHFGLHINDDLLRNLIEDTDYGLFKDSELLFEALQYASRDLVDLNLYFLNNSDIIKVDELTVSSNKDQIVTEESTNLDSFLNLPSGADSPKSKHTSLQSRHIYLKNLGHASSPYLNYSGKSYIDVDRPDHPVVVIADSFFRGTDRWKKLSVKSNAKNGFMMLDLRSAQGFKPAKIGDKDITLKRIFPSGRKKKVRLLRNNDSLAFYSKNFISGKYELSLPIGKKKVKSYNFMIELVDGSGTVVEFDPDNPPPDPDDPGDDDGGGDDGGGDDDKTDLPSDVFNLPTLQQFIKIRYPAESITWLPPDSFRDLIGRIRDDLAATYPNIERVNDQGSRYGYTAPDEKHVDVIYLVSTAQVIDFARGSTEGGVLMDKLQWSGVAPPW